MRERGREGGGKGGGRREGGRGGVGVGHIINEHDKFTETTEVRGARGKEGGWEGRRGGGRKGRGGGWGCFA